LRESLGCLTRAVSLGPLYVGSDRASQRSSGGCGGIGSLRGSGGVRGFALRRSVLRNGAGSHRHVAGCSRRSGISRGRGSSCFSGSLCRDCLVALGDGGCGQSGRGGFRSDSSGHPGNGGIAFGTRAALGLLRGDLSGERRVPLARSIRSGALCCSFASPGRRRGSACGRGCSNGGVCAKRLLDRTCISRSRVNLGLRLARCCSGGSGDGGRPGSFRVCGSPLSRGG
jgi:hypothetical protein